MTTTTIVHYSRPLDRALGAVVTLSLGILVVRFVTHHVRDEPWLSALLETIRGWWKSQEEESSPVVHHGACHCRAIVFEFQAPSSLHAKDGNGKIHYPHVCIPACDFNIISGQELLKMYYILVPASGSSNTIEPATAAFTFCSRCGVYVLHAPSANSRKIHVNVDLLENKPRVMLSKEKQNFAGGVPIPEEDRWDAKTDAFTTTSATSAEDEDLQFHDQTTIVTPQSTKAHNSPLITPSTPTTVATESTDSMPEPVARLHPPMDVRRLERRDLPSTSPIMRDQLKYFMSKHFALQPKDEEIVTNEVVMKEEVVTKEEITVDV